ncbi:hypothetical protein J6590_016447 [Homalodisca vitripennis]|nr:hypothetical protein J6590_016447 [Homalodisca vitripennis]
MAKVCGDRCLSRARGTRAVLTLIIWGNRPCCSRIVEAVDRGYPSSGTGMEYYLCLLDSAQLTEGGSSKTYIEKLESSRSLESEESENPVTERFNTQRASRDQKPLHC